MITQVLWLLALAVFVACAERDGQRASGEPSDLEASGGGDLLITETGIPGISLCDPLFRVDSVFPSARDTVAFGEGDETGWASKVVTMAHGEDLLFETSWVDTLHVWRISTTGSRFRTRAGLRVGSTIAEVLATGDSLEFGYPEGILTISLARDGVGLLVDDSSAISFWRVFDYPGDPLRVLDRGARIKVLWIGGDCRGPKAAA